MILNLKLLLVSLMIHFNISFNSPYIKLDKYDIKRESYLNEAHDVLEHYPKRKVEAWMMADAYIYCLKEYNIEVPLNIALAQGLWESGFGKTNKTNPYNIRGEGNNYHHMFESTEKGVLEYYKLMSTQYLPCKTEEQLLYRLTNCGGARYAESPTYESALRRAVKMFENYKND
jgi:hypothetical protein